MFSSTMAGRCAKCAVIVGVAGLLGLVPTVSPGDIIISDDFNDAAEWSSINIEGRTPTVADLPGSTWVLASGDGAYEAHIRGYHDFPAQTNQAEHHNVASSAISLASSGSYVKPTRLQISGDLSINQGGTNNPQGVILGFYSALPNAGGKSLALYNDFTGFRLEMDGGLTLIEDGVIGTTIPFTGQFDPAILTNLTYDVDTTTGAVSNVVLAGSSSTYAFSSTAFTDAATLYAGIGGQAGSSSSVFVDNLVVSSAAAGVPEPASLVLLGLGGLALLALRRRAR